MPSTTNTLLIGAAALGAFLVFAPNAFAAIVPDPDDAGDAGSKAGQAAGQFTGGALTGFFEGAFASGAKTGDKVADGLSSVGIAPDPGYIPADPAVAIAQRSFDGEFLGPTDIAHLRNALADARSEGLSVSESLYTKALALQGIVGV